MIRDHLAHLEYDCHNTSRTRNLRLTAIRSFMKYVEYQYLQHSIKPGKS